jgi:hypothetical protein
MTKPVLIMLLAVTTIAAVGLQLLDPIGLSSAGGWIRAALPLLLAGGMAQHAYRAHQRAEEAMANALLLWAGMANGIIAMIVSSYG